MTIKSMPPTPEYLSNWDRVFVKGYGFKRRGVEKQSSHLVHTQEIEGSTPSPAIIKPKEKNNERVNNKKRNKRLVRK